MWKKWKESELFKKMKQIRVNRAVYLSAVIILLSLAVVLAITAATNRAKKGQTDDTTPDTTQTEPNTEPTVKDPADKDDTQPTVKEETVPELSLPVSGKLIQKHSVDVQVFSNTLGEWRTHLGIDIATAEGAPVCAVAAGTVAEIWEDPLMGWCIALTHSGDSVTVYKNLAKEMAEGLAKGNEVKKGQLLGYVGDTAMIEIAEEPHLHMEMTVKGLLVDPLEYFSAAVIQTLSEDTIYEQELGK